MTFVHVSLLMYLKSSYDLDEHVTEDEFIRYTDAPDILDCFITVNIVLINRNKYDFRNLKDCRNYQQ